MISLFPHKWLKKNKNFRTWLFSTSEEDARKEGRKEYTNQDGRFLLHDLPTYLIA